MKTLSVIIPCYNEIKTISTILERVSGVALPSGWALEVVVVDDGSKDGTRDLLKNHESRFKIIYHQKNQGKGSAVRTGLARAQGDYMLIQDADLEYDPEDIPALLNTLGDNQKTAVYGSRNLNPTERKGKWLPRLGVWSLTKEFNLLYGTKLTDLWTCYKLFPKSSAPLFVPGQFDSELIFSARLIKNGYTIVEVPISYNPRSLEEGKKIRYRDGLKGMWTILKESVS